MVEQEKANATLTLSLEKERDVAVIIGQKGVVARSIEADFKCRIDIEKKTLIVTIKGGSEDIREAAARKMKELVTKDREETIARQLLAKEKKDHIELVAVKNNTISCDHISKNDDLDALKANEIEKNISSNQFPTKPVGVAKSSKNGNNKKKKKKVDSSVNEGTEAGKSLFAMLMSQD